MKMGKCRKCGQAVGTETMVCPFCKAVRPAKKDVRNAVLILGGIFVLITMLAIWAGSGSTPASSPEVATATPSPSEPSTFTPSASSADATKTSAAEPVVTPPPVPAEPPSPWSYRHEEDPMSGKTSHVAGVMSTNQLEFDFPYNGPQYGQLFVRTHPQHGKDIIVQIEKGQILCRSYEDCTVRVRFDDAAPMSWSAVGPADNSNESVFLRNYAGFMKRLTKAKRVRIALPVYQEGEPVLEFDVHGFDAEQYNPKK